jgi:hypothetical protein
MFRRNISPLPSGLRNKPSLPASVFPYLTFPPISKIEAMYSSETQGVSPQCMALKPRRWYVSNKTYFHK